MSNSTLQLGSSGADVLTLKRLLNSAGFTLADNDQFDEETSKAVSQYQSANQLPVSGTANAATWAKLASNAVIAMPEGLKTADRVQYLENNRPAAYTSAYAQQLDDLMEQVLNREKFSYDPAQDELYNRYREQYLYLGKRAMNDARGGASTLTGGYDNSFAESAGQQALQNQLAQLSDKLPELYKLALSAYDAETSRLAENLSTLTEAEKAAYDRYQNDLNRYTEALKYYYQKMQDEQEQANWEAKNAPQPTLNVSSVSASTKPKEETVDVVAVQKALPNILTQTEFQRRKNAGSSSLKAYATYAEYCAAMKKKYGV